MGNKNSSNGTLEPEIEASAHQAGPENATPKMKHGKGKLFPRSPSLLGSSKKRKSKDKVKLEKVVMKMEGEDNSIGAPIASLDDGEDVEEFYETSTNQPTIEEEVVMVDIDASSDQQAQDIVNIEEHRQELCPTPPDEIEIPKSGGDDNTTTSNIALDSTIVTLISVFDEEEEEEKEEATTTSERDVALPRSHRLLRKYLSDPISPRLNNNNNSTNSGVSLASAMSITSSGYSLRRRDTFSMGSIEPHRIHDKLKFVRVRGSLVLCAVCFVS